MIGHSVYGSGTKTVMLLHEWLGDSRNWNPLLPYLPKTTHRFVFADLRGYGRSKQIEGKFTLHEAATDVIALAAHLGVDHFDIVAHSMSSLVAQSILQVWPGLVDKLLLISPVPASGFKMDAVAFDKLLTITFDDENAMEAIALRTGKRYENGWLRAKLSMARDSADVSAMRGYAQMFTKSDISKAAHGITVPIHTISGKHDLPIYQTESVRNLFSPLYPNFSQAECLEAGHYSMLEAPVFVASEIERFLRL